MDNYEHWLERLYLSAKERQIILTAGRSYLREFEAGVSVAEYLDFTEMLTSMVFKAREFTSQGEADKNFPFLMKIYSKFKAQWEEIIDLRLENGKARQLAFLYLANPEELSEAAPAIMKELAGELSGGHLDA